MSWTTLALTILGLAIGFGWSYVIGQRHGWEQAIEHYDKQELLTHLKRKMAEDRKEEGVDARRGRRKP